MICQEFALEAEDGDDLWQVMGKKMGELLTQAITIINDVSDYHETKYGEVAFGLDRNDFVNYAMAQFQMRFSRIEKAGTQILEKIMFKKPAAAELL
ncbi:MAG: hypothetical protein IIA61_14325 [Candidatus Marinimicrobia bacterium]|nr:hypothetical protein [Candidatus Neomarinimicrobiota bacterium]